MLGNGITANTRVFRGTSKNCVSCHRDPHYGQFQRHGPENCDACHKSPWSWRTISFDHNKQSKFPLEGAHAKLECSKCHLKTIAEDGNEVVTYKPIDRKCSNCHDIPPQATTR